MAADRPGSGTQSSDMTDLALQLGTTEGDTLEHEDAGGRSTADDPYCLALLRNYRSLMAPAQDARKTMFELRAADGALGSTARLVQICFDEFAGLADALLDRSGVREASQA